MNSRIEPSCLAELIRGQGPALVLFARQWSESAEDVVQEAFLELMQQKPAPKNVLAWLYRVVRNRAINAARGAVRRAKHETAAAKQQWFLANSEDSLDYRDVRQALNSLPIEFREVIVARLWGGRTYEEIAELTETSTATAYRRYVRGLDHLRKEMAITCSNSHRKKMQ